MNKQLVLVVAVVSGVMLTYGALTIPAQESQEQRPDVFLVMTEATRADHIGPCYGYNRSTAPNICGLAEDGVLFENAYSQGSYTPIAVPTLLTSLPPSGVKSVISRPGSAENIGPEEFRLAYSYTTFPEVLGEEGYSIRTQLSWWNASWIVSAQFIQGFNKTPLLLPQELPPRDEPSFVWWFIREQAHGRWSPHTEYRRWDEVKYSTQYLDTKEPWNWTGFSPEGWNLSLYGYGEEDVIDLYDEEVLQADAEIGRLVERLKAEGRYEDSLIIVTSDHGEFFGEHTEPFISGFHGGPPYDEVVHVPLVVKFPGNDFAGTRVEQPVRHIDVAPTLYDYLGIEKSEPFGTSLLPAINGNKLNLTTYAAGGSVKGAPPHFYWSLRRSGYKYVLKGAESPCSPDNATEELYETEEESGEIFLQQERIREMQEERCRIYSRAKQYRETPVEVRENRERVKERLRELGYVQ